MHQRRQHVQQPARSPFQHPVPTLAWAWPPPAADRRRLIVAASGPGWIPLWVSRVSGAKSGTRHAGTQCVGWLVTAWLHQSRRVWRIRRSQPGAVPRYRCALRCRQPPRRRQLQRALTAAWQRALSASVLPMCPARAGGVPVRIWRQQPASCVRTHALVGAQFDHGRRHLKFRAPLRA